MCSYKDGKCVRVLWYSNQRACCGAPGAANTHENSTAECGIRPDQHPQRHTMYGESDGPMIVACQWNKSSPAGPALQEVGGSLCRSCSSFWMRLEAMVHCKR